VARSADVFVHINRIEKKKTIVMTREAINLDNMGTRIYIFFKTNSFNALFKIKSARIILKRNIPLTEKSHNYILYS